MSKGIPLTEKEIKEAEATFKAMEEIREEGERNGKVKQCNSRAEGSKKPV